MRGSAPMSLVNAASSGETKSRVTRPWSRSENRAQNLSSWAAVEVLDRGIVFPAIRAVQGHHRGVEVISPARAPLRRQAADIVEGHRGGAVHPLFEFRRVSGHGC